jgi:class 3 adenylate cyclase
MFGDLVGSTSILGQLGAESYREVILEYQDACTKIITSFGGFVTRFFGDGILVYFGYPQAHEDDAESAVRAGLVMVGDIIGEGASQQSTALGETPNLAARIVL